MRPLVRVGKVIVGYVPKMWAGLLITSARCEADHMRGLIQPMIGWEAFLVLEALKE